MIPEHVVQQLHAEVVIVGGGTAGCLAAIAAADEGAAVLVIERDNALGGVGTRAGLHMYHWGSQGGYQDVLDHECREMTKLFGVKADGFSPDIKRVVLARSFQQRNIKVMFQTILCDAVRQEDQIKSIRVSCPDGVYDVTASIYIDATGDADLTALVDGKFSEGRERDGLYHPLSFVPRFIDERWTSKFINIDGGWVDSSDPTDISRALVDTRESIRAIYNKVGRLLSIAPQIGIREGRHIEGVYKISMDDYISDRTYPDTIVRTYSHYDNHARDFGNENDHNQIWVVLLGLLKVPLYGDIPYRSILPRDISNLLVTGRAFSAHRDVFAGMRMQRDMQKLGEATGVAASLAVHHNTNAHEINVAELQQKLLLRGVLSNDILTRTGTPNLSFTTGSLAGREMSRELAAELLPELVNYLGEGAIEEGIAIWWISKTGELGKAFLAQWIQGDLSYESKRAAAFAQAILGDYIAVDMLLYILKIRDPYCPPPAQLKPLPRWVAALTALRLLKAKEALNDVLDLLEEEHNPGYYSFMLRYLADLGPMLSQEEKQQVIEVIKQWLQGEAPRAPFFQQGARTPITYEWNLEMNAALVLHACGNEEGLLYCTKYVDDSRAYVRHFAIQCCETIQGKEQP